jgi:hypothetical protein
MVKAKMDSIDVNVNRFVNSMSKWRRWREMMASIISVVFTPNCLAKRAKLRSGTGHDDRSDQNAIDKRARVDSPCLMVEVG